MSIMIRWWCCPPALPRPPGCLRCFPMRPFPCDTEPRTVRVFLRICLTTACEKSARRRRRGSASGHREGWQKSGAVCAAPIAGARVGHSAVACNKLLLTATAPAAMLGQRGLVAEPRPRALRPGTAMATAQRRYAAPMPGGRLLAQAQRRSRECQPPTVPAAACLKTEQPSRKAGSIRSCRAPSWARKCCWQAFFR